MPIKSLSNINTREFRAIAKEIRSIANAKSKFIYVYSYKNLKATHLRTLIQNPNLKHKTPKKIIRKGHKHLESTIDFGRVYSVKTSRWETLNKLSKKWAVKIEGQASPINKEFNSSQEAIDYAQSLLLKGLGKAIKLFDE